MPYIYPAWVSRGTKCKLIISPRGNLAIFPLNQSKWKKKLMWFLWQKNAFMDATCIHATSDNEYSEIRAAGIEKKPVAIIHNGINLPLLQPEGYQCNIRDEDELSTLLYFGRMAPIKGIDILLEAWSAIYKLFPTWNLVIAGTDERGYRKKMENLANELKLDRVQFAGPAYGDDKFKIYRNAQLFVLPTHNENFGMTVAEALAHKLPVIVTKGAPWGGIESHGCGWWIDTGAEPLIEALKKALSETPEQLRARGRKGREWMKKDFSWESIGQKMFMTYKWLLEGGERPPWVRLN
jgi:glycosyltransferase involved in cell wall biosynthesis